MASSDIIWSPLDDMHILQIAKAKVLSALMFFFALPLELVGHALNSGFFS